VGQWRAIGDPSHWGVTPATAATIRQARDVILRITAEE
jgi:hypothetical protein